MKKLMNLLFLSFIVASMFLIYATYNQSRQIQVMSNQIELLNNKNDDYKKNISQLNKKVNELNTVVEEHTN